MNRWLTRKKDGAEDAAAKKKKSKRDQEDVKPEFNITTALPQIDDFRTSLIMPGLSTRFSMLREQDDPASKLGEPSHDSPLSPKRQSRLHEFGFVPGGLSDIAEVSSLHGSIRPPLASTRNNSLDGRADDDGASSVMSRARPGEGNVLFGGRQKIYVVSHNSTKGLGRTLYDDDVNMSAYQRLRQEEKDRLGWEAEQASQQSEPPSPSSRHGKRETASSNSSSLDTRSTVATSIASLGASSSAATSPISPMSAAFSSGNKGRRLYDQGLDQHMQEQQTSAINRLNSLQRPAGPNGRSTPPSLGQQTRSATNLNDRFHRGPAFRSDSPKQFGHSGVSRNNSSAAASPILAHPQSPALASPLLSESEETYALHAALQPNDRGKATAMGAFNKPKEAFSEERYAQRLQHLPQERDVESTSSAPRKPTLRERAELAKRKRLEAESAEGQASAFPVESGAPATSAASAFSRFQAAASQMKASGTAWPSSMPKQPESSPRNTATNADHSRTLFPSSDSSDADEEAPKMATRRFENLPVATGPAPSLLEHPALRSRSASREKLDQSEAKYNDSLPSALSRADVDPKSTKVFDSPTLGPDSGGLSGLIRQHLRNVSAISSNYDMAEQSVSDPPTGLAITTHGMNLLPQKPGSETGTPAPSTYSHSNPWDLDDIENPYRDERGSMSSYSPMDYSHAQPLVLSATTPTEGPWESHQRKAHERMESDSSEAEHQAFQRGLEQKQQLIHENLRARTKSRSSSPAPTPPATSGGLKTALNMLRAKSSRESFATVDRPQDVPPRLMRKLTLGGGSANLSSTSLAALHESEVQAPRSMPTRVLHSEQDAPQPFESRQRSGTDASRTGRPAEQSRQASTRSSTRDRSGSGQSSGRSRSRPDVSRGRLDPPTLGEEWIDMPHFPPPMPLEIPANDGQSRLPSPSKSRSTAVNYFDSRHHVPLQTATPSLPSPNLSLPQPKFPGSAPISPRPSPGFVGLSQPSSPMPSFAGSHTPPLSNPGTPSAVVFPPASPLLRTGMLRKKSIAKADISEPIFISTTSTVDLVHLPAGASLKNGAEEEAPPVPPINPMRRRFGFGRENSNSSQESANLEAPRAPFADKSRHNSVDALDNKTAKTAKTRTRMNKLSNEKEEIHAPAERQVMSAGNSPAMMQGSFWDRNNSPPRPINSRPIAQQPMNGAMF